LPTPAKTSIPDIVAAGRQILEADGVDALTLVAVADAVGVRAPSLYKRIDGRSDLVRRISNDVAADLQSRLEAAAASGDARTDLRAMARTARTFAHENPHAYSLLFGPLPETWRIDPALNAEVGAVILRVTAKLAGPEEALSAARTVVAWLNGFLAMELNGSFRLGGDVEAAFDYGIDRILDGITRPAR
jgi:AcrR family transcriptional regulator